MKRAKQMTETNVLKIDDTVRTSALPSVANDPAYQQAKSNRDKLAADLAATDRELAELRDRIARGKRLEPGADLVVGLEAAPADELPSIVPVLGRRRRLESAIKLQDQVLERLRAEISQRLSRDARPAVQETIRQMHTAAQGLRAAVAAYLDLRSDLQRRFDVVGAEVPIDPSIFGPESSRLVALIARLKDAID